MILKKPYAFIIKYFKTIHFIIVGLIIYLIYRTNLVLGFISNYISLNTSVVGQNLVGTLFNSSMFIIPLLIIIFSLIFLGIMYKKEKPYMFYIINTFIFVGFLATVFYTRGVIYSMQLQIIDIRPIKIIHDLLIIFMGLEVVSFIAFLIRAIGFDIKRFDFIDDLNRLDINESDKEEFEVGINIDFDERRRKRKRTFRYLKYSYIENKLFINLAILLVISVGGYYIYKNINIYNKTNAQDTILSLNNIKIGVEESYLTDKNYLNEKINEDKFLVIVKIKVQPLIESQKLVLEDFKLKIDNYTFFPQKNIKEEVKDIGNLYINQELRSGKYDNYILVFTVDKNLINSDMILNYTNQNKNIDIKLEPIMIDENIKQEKYKLKQLVSFKKSVIGDIKLKINSYEISNKFKLEYTFKGRDNKAYKSIEYVTPKIDSNYDKVLLKLEYDFIKNDSNNQVVNFKQLIENYGIIKYNINGKTKYQKKLKTVSSNKINKGNVIYIQTNEELKNSTKASLIIKIRNKEYNFILF